MVGYSIAPPSNNHESKMDVSRRRFLGGRPPGPAPFRPPWSVAEAAFLDRCSRCDDCLAACPTGLLKRGQGDTTQKPWSFGIVIGEGCLAAQNVECRVCGEACDADAIRFRPRIGGVPLPDVDNAACTGCGACIAPCPVVAVTRTVLNPAPESP